MNSDPETNVASPTNALVPRDPEARRQVILALIIGVMYVAINVALRTSWVKSALYGTSSLEANDIALRGNEIVARGMVLALVPFAILAIGLLRARDGDLALALRLRPVRWIIIAFALSCASFTALNAINLWPFTWRYASRDTLLWVRTMLSGGQVFGVYANALSNVLVIPIVEEVAFRFGVLRLVVWVTGSVPWAIFLSAVLFGFLHLGDLDSIDPSHLNNSIWLFGLSILLGFLVARSSGRLGVAIAIHSARNFVEMALLLLIARAG